MRCYYRPVGSKKKWKNWGLALVVNLGAALAAALVFVAWKQFQSPQTTAAVPYKGDAFYTLVDDVGHIPKPNSQMTGRVEAGGRTIYDVVYTTGADGFRVVPEATREPDACVLLFGGSFTFGDGVGDVETFASQMVKLSQGRIAVRNFGVSGWGPHQILAGLQSGRFQAAARCRPTDAVFLLAPQQIWWANGVLNPWDKNGPRYRLTADGRPVRDGVLGDPDRYNWRRWLGMDPVSRWHAISLAKAIIVEAAKELREAYPQIQIHFISYRVSTWDDVNLSAADLQGFEYHLQQAGIMPLPLEAIIPRYRFAQRDYIFDSTDHHPNPRAHQLIAEFILREIGPHH